MATNKPAGFRLPDVAGVVGASAVFLAFYLLLSLPLWLSAAAGLAVFAGIGLIFRPNRFRVGKISVTDEAAYRSVESVVGDGYQKMDELRSYVKTVRSPAVSAQVAHICEVGDKIFNYIQQNPGKVRGARRFFSYYLGTACNILARYTVIERQGLDSEDIRQSLQKAEHTLRLLSDAVEHQLENLVQNDVFDLESEIAALESTIKSEDTPG